MGIDNKKQIDTYVGSNDITKPPLHKRKAKNRKKNKLAKLAKKSQK